MIITPEQMREAAASDNDLIRRGDVTAIPLLGMTVTQIERAIRAIPIAPQPSENRLFDPDSHWGDFIQSAVAEANKAMRKYPQPNYVITKVAEEAGEVVKAAVHAAEGRETLDNVRGEMLQLVAMLFRLWMEGDQVHGLPPVSGVMAVSANTASPQPVAVTVKPTDAQINSACLSYRHDFGLMNNRDQDSLRFAANEWFLAWQKEARILSAITIQPADPLSDPRVVALVEAATKLELSNDTICGARPRWLYEHMLAAGLSDHLVNLDDARGNLRAALRAIGGEA